MKRTPLRPFVISLALTGVLGGALYVLLRYSFLTGTVQTLVVGCDVLLLAALWVACLAEWVDMFLEGRRTARPPKAKADPKPDARPGPVLEEGLPAPLPGAVSAAGHSPAQTPAADAAGAQKAEPAVKAAPAAPAAQISAARPAPEPAEKPEPKPAQPPAPKEAQPLPAPAQTPMEKPDRRRSRSGRRPPRRRPNRPESPRPNRPKRRSRPGRRRQSPPRYIS